MTTVTVEEVVREIAHCDFVNERIANSSVKRYTPESIT